MLGVDGEDLRPRGLGELGHELAAHDQRLLVGQGEVDALAQRRHRRPEAGRAHEAVEHQVGPGLHHQADEALGARQHLAVGPRLGGAGSGVGVGQRDAAYPVLAGLGDQGTPTSARPTGPTSSRSGATANDLERLRSDRPRRAENEEAASHSAPVYGAEFRCDEWIERDRGTACVHPQGLGFGAISPAPQSLARRRSPAVAAAGPFIPSVTSARARRRRRWAR